MRNKKGNYAVAAIAAILFAGFCLSMIFSGRMSVGTNGKIVLPSKNTVPEQTVHNGSGETGNVKYRTEIKPAELTAENIGRVIETLERPMNYSYEVLITYYYGEDTFSQKLLRYTTDGYTKTELLNSSGVPVTHVITGKTHIFMWDTGNTKYYASEKGSFSGDDFCSVPTYEDIIDLNPGQITGAAAVTFQNLSCICVEFEDAEVNYSYKYLISADNGLLLCAEAFDADGNPAYRTDISRISENTVSREILRLCDNKFADDYEAQYLQQQ